MSPSCMCVVPLLIPMDCSFNVALCRPFWRIIWLHPVSFPMAASVLLPQNPFFFLTCHLSVVLYMVLWRPTLSQSSVIFQSMSKWWLLLVHLWNANGDDAHHLSNKNMVCWCFSLRSMDGILHMRAKCWRRTSMVCTLHGAWSIPNWIVHPLNCSPWRLWTSNRMKPSSMCVALSLLTFGKCSLLVSD